MPETKPSQSVCASRSGAPAICRNGSIKTCWKTCMASTRPRSVPDAEVGVDHILALLHDLRRVVADLLPVIQNHDPIREVHHHAHIVLDERDGGAKLAVHVEDEAAHILLLLQVHADIGSSRSSSSGSIASARPSSTRFCNP